MKNDLGPRDHHLVAFASHLLHQNAHTNGGRIDIDELQRRALLPIGQRFTDVNLFKASEPDNLARAGVFRLNLLEAFVSEKCGDRSAFATLIAMNAHNRVTYGNPTADDAAQRDPAEIIAVVKIRHDHLEERFA